MGATGGVIATAESILAVVGAWEGWNFLNVEAMQECYGGTGAPTLVTDGLLYVHVAGKLLRFALLTAMVTSEKMSSTFVKVVIART
jgi:hypothetical protein